MAEQKAAPTVASRAVAKAAWRAEHLADKRVANLVALWDDYLAGTMAVLTVVQTAALTAGWSVNNWVDQTVALKAVRKVDGLVVQTADTMAATKVA